ncbi:putative ribonuclease H-like domain-containing protein [Tanacetum coccineum]
MPPKLDLFYTGLEEFSNEPKIEKSKDKSSDENPKEIRTQPEIKEKTIKPSFTKIEFVKANIDNKARKTVEKVEQPRPTTHRRENQRNWNVMMSQRLAHSSVTRPIKRQTTSKNRYSNQKVNTVWEKKVNTAKPTVTINAAKAKARLNVVKAKRVNVVKASACWGNPQVNLQDKGVIDSGCSRHMIGNMSYLIDYKEIYGGYVAFGSNPREGRSLAKNSFLFTDTECIVLSPDFKLADENHVLLKVPRQKNMYSVDPKNIVPKGGLTCLFAKANSDESKLWHRRLGHLNFKTMNKLVKINLVRSLPSKFFKYDESCVACQKGKQHSASCKTKAVNTISQPLQMLHIDLFGLTFVKSLMKKMYCLVVTDDYSRTPTLSFMRPFGCPVTILNTIDHIGKFDEKDDEGFFVGYSLNSKAFRVFNSRTRIVEENLHINFSENTPNIVGSRPSWLFDIDALTKTMNYEPVVALSNKFLGTKAGNNVGQARKEKEPTKDYILLPLWNADPPFSFNPKSSQDARCTPSCDDEKKDDEVPRNESDIDDQERPDNENSTNDINIVGLSINTASTNVNTGSLNINIVSPPVNTVRSNEATYDDFFGAEANMRSLGEIEIDMSNITTTYPVPTTPNTRIHIEHSLGNVIGDVQSGVQTRRMTKTTDEQGFISVVYEGKTHEDLHTCLFTCFLSQEEPKKVWVLVDFPKGKRAIGSKWIFRNKKDERGIVISNKAMLVAQGHTQEEGIYYDEVFAPMDLKSAFLYRSIEEEVYVCQPLRFKDPNHPDKIYKVVKALYGLHQAPRAWYETLAKYLLNNGFHRGKIDQTLFIKRQIGDIVLV